MSAQLQWELIKNSSCFIVKDKKTGTSFSKEPNNLHGKNCYKYNGLVHSRVIGITPGEGRKGVVLSYKKRKCQNKPSQMYARMELKSKDPRKIYKTIRKTLGNMHYRRDLIEFAVRRSSVILRKQIQPVRRSKKSRKGKTNK